MKAMIMNLALEKIQASSILYHVRYFRGNLSISQIMVCPGLLVEYLALLFKVLFLISPTFRWENIQ